MSELTRLEKDALNVCLNWFGGKFNSMDIWVASINKSIIRDLQEDGYLRKCLIGWEITKRGREKLKESGITKFSDTRNW